MSLKANNKLLFVSGLADEVSVETLKAAFIPFGEIVDCQIPIDYKTRVSGLVLSVPSLTAQGVFFCCRKTTRVWVCAV